MKRTFFFNKSLTRIEQSLRDVLESSTLPVLTSYMLFQELRNIYLSGQKLWLRKPLPLKSDLQKIITALLNANVLTNDKDFSKVYRIVSNSDCPADEICGIVQPLCYISHLSAMARYGLTDRRPSDLYLTAPSLKNEQLLWRDYYVRDYGTNALNYLDSQKIFTSTVRSKFPAVVRKQPIKIFRVNHLGKSQKVRGKYSRIASIGQVFCDMLEKPEACGGMSHVIETWKIHALTYLNEIIEIIDSTPKKITKVRAGYLLNELLNINDIRIDNWVKFTQRGSSQLLDPQAPFASKFSEKWMLSLNVFE